MNRRPFLAAVAAGTVGATAGCLSSFLDDVTTYEASPTRVLDHTATDAGYNYDGTIKSVEERDFGGDTAEVTNYRTEYRRTVELPVDVFESDPQIATFTSISTPQVDLAGQDLNPVDDLNEKQLAEYIELRHEEFELGENVDSRTVDLNDLDGSVTFQTYAGSASFHGLFSVDVFLDIARTEHDDDHLVFVAIYPDQDELPLASDLPLIEEIPLPSLEGEVDEMTADVRHGDDLDVTIRRDPADIDIRDVFDEDDG